MDQVVFLDLSHYIFHRYYAIQTWLKFSKQNIDDKDALIERYSRLFEENLVDLKKKLKFEWCNFYMVKDCTRDSIWRKKYFEGYKGNRDGKDDDKRIDPTIFPYTYEVLLPRLNAKYGFHLLWYKNAEADDIIAVLHKKLRHIYPMRKVIIITNDNDYLQLLDEYTIIMNTKKQELKKRFDDDVLKVFTKWKVIRGDESDNIPPIEKKIGNVVALKLASDDALLEKKLANPDVLKQYRLNDLLINFDRIPDDMVKGIMHMAF